MFIFFLNFLFTEREILYKTGDYTRILIMGTSTRNLQLVGLKYVL